MSSTILRGGRWWRSRYRSSSSPSSCWKSTPILRALRASVPAAASSRRFSVLLPASGSQSARPASSRPMLACKALSLRSSSWSLRSSCPSTRPYRRWRSMEGKSCTTSWGSRPSWKQAASRSITRRRSVAICTSCVPPLVVISPPAKSTSTVCWRSAGQAGQESFPGPAEGGSARRAWRAGAGTGGSAGGPWSATQAATGQNSLLDIVTYCNISHIHYVNSCVNLNGMRNSG